MILCASLNETIKFEQHPNSAAWNYAVSIGMAIAVLLIAPYYFLSDLTEGNCSRSKHR
jgi:hypothetical protein